MVLLAFSFRALRGGRFKILRLLRMLRLVKCAALFRKLRDHFLSPEPYSAGFLITSSLLGIIVAESARVHRNVYRCSS